MSLAFVPLSQRCVMFGFLLLTVTQTLKLTETQSNKVLVNVWGLNKDTVKISQSLFKL